MRVPIHVGGRDRVRDGHSRVVATALASTGGVRLSDPRGTPGPVQARVHPRTGARPNWSLATPWSTTTRSPCGAGLESSRPSEAPYLALDGAACLGRDPHGYRPLATSG